MESKIKGYLIDLRDGSAKTVEFVDKLENLYELINCDIIDITERKVGDYWYDIVCDDEGLLKDRRIPTAINKKKEPQLVGNLLFVNHDEEGDLASLSEEQIKTLEEHTIHYLYDDGHWVQLVPCIEGLNFGEEEK